MRGIALLSVLALSSRFDGRGSQDAISQFSKLSVLALSSRFDGPHWMSRFSMCPYPFSTRSVESF